MVSPASGRAGLFRPVWNDQAGLGRACESTLSTWLRRSLKPQDVGEGHHGPLGCDYCRSGFEPPTKSRRPSSNVMLLPLARVAPSLAR